MRILYFVHNQFEKINFNSVKRNGTFEGVGVSFLKFSYVKVSRAMSNSGFSWFWANSVGLVYIVHGRSASPFIGVLIG